MAIESDHFPKEKTIKKIFRRKPLSIAIGRYGINSGKYCSGLAEVNEAMTEPGPCSPADTEVLFPGLLLVMGSPVPRDWSESTFSSDKDIFRHGEQRH